MSHLGHSGVIPPFVITDLPGGTTHFNEVTILDVVNNLIELIGRNHSGQRGEECFIFTRYICIFTILPPPLHMPLHNCHVEIGLAIVEAVHCQDNIHVGGDVVVVTIGDGILRVGVLGVDGDDSHFVYSLSYVSLLLLIPTI